MRIIGRPLPEIQLEPSAEALRRAGQLQSAWADFGTRLGTGIPRGVYRFRSQAEADEQRIEAVSRVIAKNASRLRPLR